MLVTTKEMLLKAQQGRYAVGHFNTSNLETTQAIIEAAIELSSPVIIGVSVKALEYAGTDAIASIVKKLAGPAPIPVALHLDHGPNLHWAEQCLAHGFTSIMIDTSSQPFGDNIRLTREVVNLCSGAHVPVEAELGLLKGVEDYVSAADHVFTDPYLAADFVKHTGCDSLAISIGTSHGAYKFTGPAKIDLERLQQIREKVQVPLVLHGASSLHPALLEKAIKYGAKLEGASGVSEEDIRTAISLGICKVNTDTELRLAFTAAMREFYSLHPENLDYREALDHARKAVKEEVKGRIQLFGSAGKA